MRRGAPLAAALGLLLATAGCSAAGSDPFPVDDHVRTYTDLRRHYLDAMCPVNAWFAAADADRDRKEGTRLAAAGAAELAPVPKPWPDAAADAAARLRSDLQHLRSALEDGGTTPDPSSSAQAVLERIVNVSAAAGSDNCVGHPPAASARPSAAGSR